MLKMLTDEGLGFVGMSVAFMAGAVTFGLIFNAMDRIGQSAIDNVVQRIR
jgi:ribulose 1,5-bisphosphate synthetase/thiazole synthase